MNNCNYTVNGHLVCKEHFGCSSCGSDKKHEEHDDHKHCTSDADCGEGGSCGSDGKCVENFSTCGVSSGSKQCTSDADCGTGGSCGANGTCVEHFSTCGSYLYSKGLGSNCNNNDECLSGHCDKNTNKCSNAEF